MRFLDTQIKHIIDVYIKRLDKNDSSWLIAKKPLGGFSCASCKSYLGELKNRDTYFFGINIHKEKKTKIIGLEMVLVVC